MLAVVTPGALVHPFTVTVTKYCPAAFIPAFGMELFCDVETKPLGPVQS